MLVYISILLSTLIISLMGGNYIYSVKRGKIIEIKRWALITILFIFVFFFAVRWNVGTDFPNYFNRFYNSNNLNLNTIVGSRDWGFYLTTILLYKIGNGSYILYSIIIGVMLYTPIITVYRKYTNNYIVTIFLYISMCLYMWPYNGTRQAIALSILFIATYFLANNRIWMFIFILLLASTFHSSVIFVAPFIFIARYEAWSKKMILTIIILCISIIILPSLWNYIINFLDLIGQNKMANDYWNLRYLRSGINSIRIVVALVPVIVAYIYRNKLNERLPYSDLIINMCLLNLVFLVFAYRITALSRFATYFNIYLPPLVSEFANFFDFKTKKYVNLGICVLYFLHMIVLLPNESDLLPYQFIFIR